MLNHRKVTLQTVPSILDPQDKIPHQLNINSPDLNWGKTTANPENISKQISSNKSGTQLSP